MSSSDILQLAIAVLMFFGGSAGLGSIWLNRHRPSIDKRQAEDASRKLDSDLETADIDNLRNIIAEMRQEREWDKRRLDELIVRVSAAEKRAGLFDVAILHVANLEDHINKELPPPPPLRPQMLRPLREAGDV